MSGFGVKGFRAPIFWVLWGLIEGSGIWFEAHVGIEVRVHSALEP